MKQLKNNTWARRPIEILTWLCIGIATALFLHQCFTPPDDYESIADIETLVEEWEHPENDEPPDKPTVKTPVKKPPLSIFGRTPSRGTIVGTFRISSPWGFRIHPIARTRRMHRGVDVAMPEGTPYYFPGNSPGRVRCFRDRGGGGVIAQMRSPSYPGYFLEILHMQDKSCRPGKAKPGDRVGRVGSTGASTGPHAHIQVVELINGDRIHRAPPLELIKQIVGVV